MRTLENLTPASQRQTVPGGAVQVHFVANGQIICREPGKQHGFSTYAEALSWVERNTHRAMPEISGFIVEFW